MTCTSHEPTLAFENMKQPFEENNVSFFMMLYRIVWLIIVVGGILAACGWADTNSRGIAPEHTEVAP
jgi:hypothetical protein